MIDFIPICASLLCIAYRERTKPRDAERLEHLAIRLRNAHDVLRHVTAERARGQQNRRFWAAIYKHGVPMAEVSASPRLRHPSDVLLEKPRPRALRYALKTLREDFEPRNIPFAELLALRRFLEAQLSEKP